MTPMDSDSESQDSDEGRRFRFETTRKDPVAPVDTTSKPKSPKKSKHKSSRCDDSSRHYRERKERSKHDSARKTDDKDLRHLIKHTKHEWSSSRQEDGSKNSHKDHRDASAANDRSSRHSSGGSDARERSRDSKRQSERDWSVHRAQRSREHSYEKNHDELRGSGDKHRNRCRERHKHRSRDRSRERSHQSTKVKSSREDHGKSDFSRKLSVKENRSQNSKDYSSPKSARSHSSESRSTLVHLAGEDARKESSLDAPDCKELDLSQFDVLSETDENTSDGPDSRCHTLSLRHRETMHDHDPRDQSESREPPKKRARTEQREGRKVKTRNGDEDDGQEFGSSNNNPFPSAVSDSSLVLSAKTGDARADPAREKPEHREEESMTLAYNSSDAERTVSREKHSRHPAAVSDETRLFEYDSLLASELTPRAFADEEYKTSSRRLDNSHQRESRRKVTSIDDNDNRERTKRLIGPCLPPSDETKSIIESRANDPREATEYDPPEEAAFGPALPPHLLQRMRDSESRDRIIGPVLPDSVKKSSQEALSVDSDDEHAIGPLPVDHPALRNSRVYEQLDLRADRIRHEGLSEQVDVGNKREEWMTELPSAQAVNLGLGPRKFRVREAPDMSDRSCWTDTPAQKAQKQKDLEARRFSNTEESDRRRAKERHMKEADKSSKREKSLLEIHQSKMAKRKKKEEKEAKLSGESTRRPFDRDIDLQVNRFDQAQKKTILMKAQMLDDRFSRGQI